MISEETVVGQSNTSEEPVVTQSNTYVNFAESCDPERRKEFAREQVRFLRNCGITESSRVDRIFRIAGPGQIQEAYKLATSAKDRVAIDTLNCLLTGFMDARDFGLYRMTQVLKRCGFYVPQVHSENCFNRACDAALEILVPDAVDIEEMEEQGQLSKDAAFPVKNVG